MTVLFGNTPDAYTVNAAGAVQAGVMVALYTNAARTTVATGLTDEDGSPSDSALPAQTGRVIGSTVTSKTNGVLSFGAPDGTARLYYNRGDGISSVLGPRADTAYASWDGTHLSQGGTVIPIDTPPSDFAAWAPTTAYKLGDRAGLPDGGLGRRVIGAPATSRAQFDAVEAGSWDRVTFRFPWLEGVPALIVGDSYGAGGSGTNSDVGFTFLDRFCARHRTQAPTNVSVSGKRADEILAAQVVPAAVNQRGVVGIADVVLNDVSQSVPAATTAESLRSILTYLAAQAVVSFADPSIVFGPGWTSGASSAAGSYVDLPFTGDACSIIYGAVTGAGGTLTVKDPTGATVTTITTGGFGVAFNGVRKISGFGAGNHTVRVALTSGSASVLGVIIPSATPRPILWHKPGPRNQASSVNDAIVATLAACSPIAALFPTVVPVAVDSWWSNAMLGNTNHPNDLGNAYIANLVERALAGSVFFGQGLNQISTPTGTTAGYVNPASAYTSPGATVPAAPTGVTVATSNQLTVTWTRGADGGATATSQQVQLSADDFATIATTATVSASAASAVIQSGLTAGTPYKARVRAVNSVGNGTYGTSAAAANAGTAVTTYAADTFTRGDSSTPGSTEVGGYAWTVTSGNAFGIVGGVLAGQTVGTAPQDCLIDDGQANGTITATLPVAAAQVGVAFRIAVGNGSGFTFYHDPAGVYYLKQRTGASSYTTLTTVAGVTAANGDVVQIVLNGTSIIARVNGVQVATATSAVNQTATKHGMWTTATTGRLDDYSHTSSIL